MTWLDGKIAAGAEPQEPSTPSRAIGTAFQPSTTNAVLCSYTVELVMTVGQDGNLVLNSDDASTPTTARCSARLASGAGGPTITARQQLVCLVPAGDYVKLVQGGTGTITIISQEETVLS
jgi:hypothetical protein